MTIDEAIKANEHLAIELDSNGQDKLAKGVRLGIEALKRIPTTREQHLFQCWMLLPGETED